MFVNIEDFCIRPLLFDLCCCAIGCCFRAVAVAKVEVEAEAVDGEDRRAEKDA